MANILMCVQLCVSKQQQQRQRIIVIRFFSYKWTHTRLKISLFTCLVNAAHLSVCVRMFANHLSAGNDPLVDWNNSYFNIGFAVKAYASYIKNVHFMAMWPLLLSHRIYTTLLPEPIDFYFFFFSYFFLSKPF